jgi:hypothetical protein
LDALCGALEKHGVGHAATGLAAAWILTKYAAFRIATIFLEKEIPEDMMEDIGFKEEPRGANLWLVHPDDEGVFHGSSEKSGVRCVHPVQAYLDLKDHPERSAEAAGRIRDDYLAWKKNA